MNEMLLALKESYSVFLDTCQESYCTSIVSRHLPGALLWELKHKYRKNNWNLYEVFLTNISWANIKSQETAQWCIVLCLYLICLKWLRSMTPKICIWIRVLRYQLCAAHKSFPLSKPQFPLRAWSQSRVSEYVCVALDSVEMHQHLPWGGWVVGLEPSSHLYPLDRDRAALLTSVHHTG